MKGLRTTGVHLALAALFLAAVPLPARAGVGDEDGDLVLRVGEALVPVGGAAGGTVMQTSISASSFVDLHPRDLTSLLGHRVGVHFGLELGWILPAAVPGRSTPWSGGPVGIASTSAPWDVVDTAHLRLAVGPGLRLGIEPGRHPFVGDAAAFDADFFVTGIAEYQLTSAIRLVGEYALAPFGYQYTEQRLRLRFQVGHFVVGADATYGWRLDTHPYLDVAACIGWGD